MAEAPNSLVEVENDMKAALDAFEGNFPDPRERAAALLALSRRLGLEVATRAAVAARSSGALDAFDAWTQIGILLTHEVPSCTLCGGTGVLTAGVQSTERGSLPGLAVPCPACGGRK